MKIKDEMFLLVCGNASECMSAEVQNVTRTEEAPALKAKLTLKTHRAFYSYFGSLQMRNCLLTPRKLQLCCIRPPRNQLYSIFKRTMRTKWTEEKVGRTVCTDVIYLFKDPPPVYVWSCIQVTTGPVSLQLVCLMYMLQFPDIYFPRWENTCIHRIRSLNEHVKVNHLEQTFLTQTSRTSAMSPSE